MTVLLFLQIIRFTIINQFFIRRSLLLILEIQLKKKAQKLSKPKEKYQLKLFMFLEIIYIYLLFNNWKLIRNSIGKSQFVFQTKSHS